MRLTLERYIQTVIEDIVEHNPKMLKLPYNKQLELVSKGFDLMYEQPSDKCLSIVVNNISKGIPSVYRLSDKFGEHLYRTNLDIPTSVLPKPTERKTFYVQFPKSISFDYNGRTFDNMIFDIGKVSELSDHQNLNDFIAYRFYSLDTSKVALDNREIPSILIAAPTGAEVNLTEKIKESHAKNPCSIPFNILEYCLKVLLYIHSGEPDLVPEMPKYPYATTKEKYIRHIENHCPFQVLNLGYSFHERHRHVDGTIRQGHFRWQQWGPQWSKVKLIWIDEHPMNFKKD